MVQNKYSILLVAALLSFTFSNEVEAEINQKWDVVTVLGTKQDEASLPGSGDRVTAYDIRKHSYDDINRILKKVPGVYLREEDGFGLFPNISLRGVDVGRSQKVTIMEDGIMAAPAPYSAPSAYYSPTSGRMHEVEVLKGSSQVKYGPHTTGGVVNYVSTPIPEEHEFYFKALGGNHGEARVHFYVGDKVETEFGKIGYVVEEYYRDNKGFKNIDETPDFSGDDTGFTKKEPMFKMSWESNDDAPRYQKVEGKFGYTDLIANETYLGIAEIDLEGELQRRYAATRFDQIDSEQARSYLSYSTDVGDAALLTLTGYHNKFQRNWRKLHKVNGTSLSVALVQNGGNLDILKGQAAGSFDVRNNSREYEQYGYQSSLNVNVPTGNIEHDLEIGAGFHTDYVRRNQNTITYTQDGNGVITGISTSASGTAGNRRQESDVWRMYIRDSISIGDLTVTPGFRYENINYEYIDFDTTGADPTAITGRGDSRLIARASGVGANYVLNDELSFFAGVHEGFSVPGPRDNARSGLKEETSLTKEGGVRFKPNKAVNAEVVYFHTDFDNLLVADNIGGGGSGTSENVGDIISQGIEAKLQYDFGIASEKAYKNPYYISFTYTNAELDGDSNSTDPESIFAGGKDGNRVPYVPEYQFAIGTGLEFEKWGVFVDGAYVGETFTTADNVANPFEKSGTPDARFGKTDERFVVDLSGFYRINKFAKIVANIHNVGDLEYIVSRHPHGPRPGKPFTATAGVEIIF